MTVTPAEISRERDQHTGNFLASRPFYDDLANVADWLTDRGLGEILSAFNPLRRNWAQIMARRSALEPSHQALVDFFLNGAWLHEESRYDIPDWIIETLDACTLIQKRDRDGAVSLGQYSFWSVHHLWIIVERPTVATSAYFGDDSVALLSRLRPRQGERALDFCTGPGIQALWLANTCREVVGVDINPYALSLAEMNAKVNRFKNVRFTANDLDTGLNEGGFDLISANPPLIPLADDMPYGLIGHGGPDGLRFTARILDALPRLLNDRGRCQILGLTTSDGILPLALPAWEDWSRRTGIGLIVQVGHHLSMSEAANWTHKLSLTSSAFAQQTGADVSIEETSAALRIMLEKAGATALCDFFLFATKAHKDFHFIDFSVDGEPGLWYV